MIDHRDLLGELISLLEVLGSEQKRRPLADELAHDRPDLIAAARIQPGRRLVQEQHARPGEQARREVETSPHPTRVRPSRAVGGVREFEALEQLVRPPREPPRPRGRTGARTSGGSPGPSGSRRPRRTGRSTPKAPARPRHHGRRRAQTPRPFRRPEPAAWPAPERASSSPRRSARAAQRPWPPPRPGRPRQAPWSFRKRLTTPSTWTAESDITHSPRADARSSWQSYGHTGVFRACSRLARGAGSAERPSHPERRGARRRQARRCSGADGGRRSRSRRGGMDNRSRTSRFRAP